MSNLGTDITKLIILTKQEVLGDIVGNNHNEELPKNKIEYLKISDLAKKVGSEYFDKLKLLINPSEFGKLRYQEIRRNFVGIREELLFTILRNGLAAQP